jgi:hypothetical protein
MTTRKSHEYLSRVVAVVDNRISGYGWRLKSRHEMRRSEMKNKRNRKKKRRAREVGD